MWTRRANFAKIALPAILAAGCAAAQHVQMFDRQEVLHPKIPADRTIQWDGSRGYVIWWTGTADNQNWSWVNLSYNPGYVDRVQILPRVTGQGPNFALAARFLPSGYNFAQANWTGKYMSGAMQVEWWIWNVNGNWLELDSMNNQGYQWLTWSIRSQWMGLPPNQQTQPPAQLPSMQAGYWNGSDRVQYSVLLFGDGYWRGFKPGYELRPGNESFLFHRDAVSTAQGALTFRGSWVDTFGGRTAATFWMNQAGRLNMQANDVEVQRLEFTFAARFQ